MNRRFVLAFVAACLSVPAQDPAPSSSKNVDIWIAGGLLGRLRGFCELRENTKSAEGISCPQNRQPFGGLLGLASALENRPPGTQVILAGNNFPKDFVVPGHKEDPDHVFWQELRALHASVIALGQEDLLRTILPARYRESPTPDTLSSKLNFLREGVSNYRFLASNAFIRTQRPGLNNVHDRGSHLLAEPNESLPWTTSKLSVELPRGEHDKTVWTVTLNGQPVPPAKIARKAATLTFPVTVEPGANRLELTASGPDGKQEQYRFTVHADQPLTPWSYAADQAFPAAVLNGAAASLLIVSLIDPGISASLEPSRWSEKSGDQTRTLVLLPGADTAKAILQRTAGTSIIPVLMSDLADPDTLKVLRLSSRWRAVSLNPDTALLGCEAGADGCSLNSARSSLSHHAIIDGGSEGARALVRSEWVGETVAKVRIPQGNWERIEARHDYVDGLVRFATQSNVTDQPGTQIFVSAGGKQLSLLVPPQRDAGQVWWVSREDVAIVLMEAMRQSTNSELALCDLKMIDADVVAELLDESMVGSRRFSYQQLMDIFWRHDAYVRTFIKGSDLADLIGKVAQLPVAEDGGYCIRGVRAGETDLDCSLPKKPDAGTLRVNGRFLDPNMIYALAVPQSMSKPLGLGAHANAHTEMIGALLDFIRRDGPRRIMQSPSRASSEPSNSEQHLPASKLVPSSAPAPLPAKTPTAPKWKNPDENRWLSMIYLPPASIEIGGQDYKVPSQTGGAPDTSGFAAIPNVGEKVTHTFKLNLVGEFHVIPVDVPWISLDVVSKANLNRLDTYPATITGVKQIAYSPDLWTNGGVLRSRWVSDQFNQRLSQMRFPNVRIEPFIGYFDDSSIFHFDNLYQTSAKDPGTGRPLYTFSQNDRKPNYVYLGAGIALGDIKIGKKFILKKTFYEHDSGMNYTAPKKLRISNAGSVYEMEQVRRCGIQKLIDGGAGCPAATMGDDFTIRYLYAQQRQSRQQLGTSLEFASGEGVSKRTFTVDFKRNWWGSGPGGYTVLDPLGTTEINLKAAVPVAAGIAFGPYLRYYIVDAFGSPGAFRSYRYGFTLTLPMVGKIGNGRFYY